MEPRRVYFVRSAGAVRGPVGVEQLREMGSVEVITPETEIAPQVEDPWARLATLAICLEVFPARRAIAFKPAQFEVINRDATPAVDLDETIERAKRSPASRFPRWRRFAVLSVVGSTAIMSIPLLYDRRYDQMSVSIFGRVDGDVQRTAGRRDDDGSPAE